LTAAETIQYGISILINANYRVQVFSVIVKHKDKYKTGGKIP